MTSKELSNFVFTSKYARWIPEKKRRETWKEATERVRNMMLEKYKDCGIDDEINFAYDFMQKKKVLGSQRTLQFGGKDVLKHMVRGYNCSFTYIDRPRVFQEVFYTLLCGCGVGYSCQFHHVEKLPPLIKELPKETKTYVIPDNIEGWSDSVGLLISTFLEDAVFQVEFDYSQIRPKGSPLSSSSAGKAPGPEPLKKCHERITELLMVEVTNKATRLRPVVVHDILCHIADAVISGGIRRAAMIALFSKNDKEMMGAKTGDWFSKNPQRARCNNSVVLLRDNTTAEEFKELFKCTKEFGEPGIAWVNNLEHGLNPCGEISLYAYDESGHSGFEFCNLCTINVANVEDEEDFYDRCRAAAIMGTLQAGFNSFPYLGEVTENIVKREALLGVSLSGMMQRDEIAFCPKVQRKGVKIINKVNEEISQKIGINRAARLTCIKPDGNSASVLGVSSGIHPNHAKRYIRRVQNNTTDEVYQFFKKCNPQATEKSVWDASGTDENILFPIEVPDGSKLKNMVSAIQMLDMVKTTYENWIKPGTNEELCATPGITHNVSNTVTVLDDEWEGVVKYVYKNRYSLGGISFLSDKGDKDYPQAPYTTVYTSRELVKEYGEAAVWCSGLIELGLQCFNNNLWAACDFILSCNKNGMKNSILLEQNENLENLANEFSLASLKVNLYRKVVKFAKNYFDGDILRLTYCLKDVANYKTYYDIRESMKPVDYTLMVEDDDNTNFEQESACAGGACLI